MKTERCIQMHGSGAVAILKMFPALIATRGNMIIAAVLQWNIYYNKRI